MNLELYDDTGSEVISISERDIREIVINSSAQAPYISTGFIVGMGNSMMPNINLALEIALVDENHNRVVDWATWCVAVYPGAEGFSGHRMAGP